MLVALLNIKIPAMSEVYEDDSSNFTRKNWASERQHMREEVKTELQKLDAQAKTKNNANTICLVVQNLLKIFMEFLTFKPVGRPHVYISDTQWELVKESKLRFKFRKELLL
jgi:hypothetical protein